MAVKGKTKAEILAAFETRLKHDPAAEFNDGARSRSTASPRCASGRSCRDAQRIVRGRILTFRDDPRLAGARAWRLIDDGALAIEDGLIAAVGEARDILARAPKDAAIDDHAGKLVLPGFIDAHIHYPQTRVIGSYGAQLLDWLQQIHLRRGAEVRRPRPQRRGGALLPRRIVPPGHDHRLRLLHRASRNRSTRSSPRPSGAARA